LLRAARNDKLPAMTDGSSESNQIHKNLLYKLVAAWLPHLLSA